LPLTGNLGRVALRIESLTANSRNPNLNADE